MRLSQREIQEALEEEDQIEIELARLEGDDDPDREDPYRDWEEFLSPPEKGEYSQDDFECYRSEGYQVEDDPYFDMGYDDDYPYEDLVDSGLFSDFLLPHFL
jgi:hypothetical protein